MSSSQKAFLIDYFCRNMIPQSRNNEPGSKNREEGKTEISMVYQNDNGYGQLVLDIICLLRSLDEIHEIKRRMIFLWSSLPRGWGWPLGL